MCLRELRHHHKKIKSLAYICCVFEMFLYSPNFIPHCCCRVVPAWWSSQAGVGHRSSLHQPTRSPSTGNRPSCCRPSTPGTLRWRVARHASVKVRHHIIFQLMSAFLLLHGIGRVMALLHSLLSFVISCFIPRHSKFSSSFMFWTQTP